MNTDNIIRKYGDALNEILDKWLDLNEFDSPDIFWANEPYKDFVSVNDEYYLSVTDMLQDLLTEKVDESRDFFHWWDYCLTLKMCNSSATTPNLKSFKLGCPIKDAEEIRSIYKKKLELEKQIKELTNDKNNSKF